MTSKPTTRAHVHVLHDCNDANCNVCSGGLAWCTVCGGAEGSMPSECPGVRMTADQEAAVLRGHLDFKAGRWT